MTYRAEMANIGAEPLTPACPSPAQGLQSCLQAGAGEQRHFHPPGRWASHVACLQLGVQWDVGSYVPGWAGRQYALCWESWRLGNPQLNRQPHRQKTRHHCYGYLCRPLTHSHMANPCKNSSTGQGTHAKRLVLAGSIAIGMSTKTQPSLPRRFSWRAAPRAGCEAVISSGSAHRAAVVIQVVVQVSKHQDRPW